MKPRICENCGGIIHPDQEQIIVPKKHGNTMLTFHAESEGCAEALHRKKTQRRRSTFAKGGTA